MDFIIGLSIISRQNDSIMIMVDRLSKVSHFIAVLSANSSSEVAQIFIREIVRLHDVSMKIIS